MKPIRSGIFSALLISAMANLAKVFKSQSQPRKAHKGRFDLSRLPPAWKARKMARIKRGGK
jgi:hypothetical protein